MSVNVRLCFSFDGAAGIVHLSPVLHNETFCGLRAFPTDLSRRRVTCQTCLAMKLGGAA